MNRPCIFSLLNLSPISHPNPPLSVFTEHQVELPLSHSKFPLAICFTYGNVCFHATLSISPTHAFTPIPCLQVSSLCLRLHCCPENGLISTIFLESIYNALLYDIFLCIIGSRYTHAHTHSTASLSIHLSTDKKDR